MNNYVIINLTSGNSLGEVQANNEAQALEISAKNAGYDSHEDACSMAGMRTDEVVANIVSAEDDSMFDCPQTGVMGTHSESYHEGGICSWCGKQGPAESRKTATNVKVSK